MEDAIPSISTHSWQTQLVGKLGLRDEGSVVVVAVEGSALIIRRLIGAVSCVKVDVIVADMLIACAVQIWSRVF